MACKNHPDRESVAACVSCGAELCAECDQAGADGKSYCSDDLPAAAVAAAPVVAPVAVAPPVVAPAPAAASSGSNMTLAAVGYLIWICSLIVILTEKNDQQVKFQGWNGLFWGIAQIVVGIAVGIVRGVLRNAPGGGAIGGVLGIIPLAMFVFSIIFLVKALNRQEVNI
ncbi:MAG: hypothetical protein WCP21_21525, partial [Armatimonadota bacterium]